MRRTPSTIEKAERSANLRLDANQRALQEAYEADVREGPAAKQKRQFQVVTAWMRSEVTALTPEQRQQFLDHMVGLCQQANQQSRMTVLPV